jgi:acyl-CoA synthetase (AMP-forming)/AMP-acid ligase II
MNKPSVTQKPSLKPVRTLVEMLRFKAETKPDALLYKFLVDGETEEENMTYGELEQRVRRLATWLQERNMAGERALLLFPPGLDFIVAYFACLFAGVIAVPSYPPRLNRPSPRIQTIVSDAQATIALTNSEILSSMEQRFEHTPDLKALHWLDTSSLSPGIEDKWQMPNINSDTLAFIQYTSGSTSHPKGVMVSHANLLHNLELIYQSFALKQETKGSLWLPNYHDMGLIGGILEPVYFGGQVVLMSPFHFLQRPIRWLQAISKFQCDTAGAPNFAFDLCVDKTTPEQRQELDLHCWKLAFCGAEPVRSITLDRFTKAFAVSGFEKKAFCSCYGLAEATLIVTATEPQSIPPVFAFNRNILAHGQVALASSDSLDRQEFVSCGHPRLDTQVAIVNPETLQRCENDEVGEIWISGGSIAKGYWNRLEETESTFHAHIEGEDGRNWMRTGDLGFVLDDNLFITGRSKDLIIIRGSNHYPQDIELTVEQCHFALEPAGGASFSVQVDDEEKLVIVHELSRQYRNADQAAIFQAIRRSISENHDLQVDAIVLLKPLSLPKTSSGKVQRHLCKRYFLEDTLEKLGEWRMPIKNAGIV